MALAEMSVTQSQWLSKGQTLVLHGSTTAINKPSRLPSHVSVSFLKAGTARDGKMYVRPLWSLNTQIEEGPPCLSL